MCTTFQAKYTVLEKIGEGSFSEVLKCQDRQTGVMYAAKRLKKIYQNVNEVLESPEVMAMRKIPRHVNVLYMFESHYDLLPGKVTLIFELMDMSLYDLMRNRKGRLLLEVHVKQYIYQMLKGLEHLHKHGIFHRDIKPENILLKGNVVKIGDLGSIRGIYSRPPYTEYISTRWYRSPECLLTGGFYGPKMDIWAIGCVFYELLTLEPLFPGENEVDQISKIHSILGTPHARIIAKFRRISCSRTRNGDFYFPVREGRGLSYLLPQISNQGLETLDIMLIYDPENRASARKLLESPYFTDLREREAARQTRSTAIVQNPSGDSRQWRNPMVLSYLSSEKNRRIRLLNSHLRCMDSSKVPARTVESSPNARFPTSCQQLQSKLQQDSVGNMRLDELRHNTRYFLRKRQSLQNNRLNPQPKKAWYDSTVKLTSMSRSCYDNKDLHHYQRESGVVKTSRPSDNGQNFYMKDKFNLPSLYQRKNTMASSNQLPSIFHNSNRNTMSVPDSSYNSYKMSLACFRERPVQGLLTKKSTASKSPLKKMAKHEVANDYLVGNVPFDRFKILTKHSAKE